MAINRRNFMQLTGVAVGGSLLASCGSRGAGGGASLRVSQFGATPRMEVFEDLFELYAEENPDVEFTLQSASNDNYPDQLATQVSGGDAPEIMGLFHYLVPVYGRQGALADLESYFGDILDVSNFEEGTVERGRIDGAITGLSYGDNVVGAIYDADLLESLGLSLPDPGYTWDDYLTVGADISRGADGDLFGCQDACTNMDLFTVWIMQRGKYIFTESGDLGFDRSDMTEWIDMWQIFRDEEAAPPASITSEASGNFEDSALIRGYTASHLTNSNVMSSTQALTDARLELTTMPVDSAGGTTGHYIRGTNWLGLYEGGENLDVAVDFLNFVFNDPEGAGRMGAELGAPPNRDIRDDLDYGESDSKFIDYINFVTDDFSEPSPSLDQEIPPGWNEIQDSFTLSVEDHSFGRTSASEAVDEFFSAAESAIQSAA